MCQEDTEKLSFDCLRTEVDKAIKSKNICFIDRIELKENKLKYMQKYAELQVSKNELKFSFESYFIGMDSVILAIIAIGISYILFAVSKISTLETMYFILGLAIVIGGLWLKLKTVPQKRIEFEEIKKDIDFIHIIILKIEEKLHNRT